MELTVHSDIFNNISKSLSNPEIFTVVITVIVAIVAKIYLGSNENKSFFQWILEIIFWIIVGFIIISNSIRYLFGINIETTLSDLLTNNPLIEINVNNDTTKKTVKFSDKNEVFHISGNDFRYKDAEPLCKAYGARLANYDDMEKAYNKGAEWCEYGWSQDQMAYFPTQKKTWEELQSSESNKNACGRPGINGGYIANPNIRFGVNCYGIKPDISDREKCMMDNTSYYENPEDKIMNKKEEYWESRISDMLISPFNENKWSRIQ